MNWLLVTIGLLAGCFVFTTTRLIYDEWVVMREMRRERRKALQVGALLPQTVDHGVVP